MNSLEEFLGLCDADPDFDSGDDEDDNPFQRISETSQTDKQAEQLVGTSDQDFQQLFGPPLQITLNKRTVSSDNSNIISHPISLTKNSIVKKPLLGGGALFNPKPDDSVLVIDPYSRLRLFKNSVQLYFDEVQTLELSLKERNLTVPYTSLDKVSNIKDRVQFWTCGVLVKKAQGVRQSAKGNNYVIWEISDLDAADSITLFLFGAAATAESLKTVSVGALIDLTNPSIMPENKNGVSSVKLSVSLASQIRHIATARDFGFCGSRRKDGKECMNPVNKFKCDVCIHHATAELRKMNAVKKGSKWAKKSFTDHEKMQYAARMESSRGNASSAVMTTDFGKSIRKSLPSTSSFRAPAKLGSGSGTINTGKTAALSSIKAGMPLKAIRMELQDPTNSMHRKSASASSKDSNISYSRDTSPFLSCLATEDVLKRKKRELNLNPAQTKHLTDHDRFLLERLGKSKPESDLPAILTEPNAGSQNFLKYLSNTHKNEGVGPGTSGTDRATPSAPAPLVMTRETLMNMQKAISFVKSSGPIEKSDPNAVKKKRKLSVELEIGDSSKVHVLAGLGSNVGNILRKSNGPLVSNNGDVDINSVEFQRILNAKSAHSNIAEDNQEADYFSKLERKEAIENKLLSTFSMSTTAFMCRECKYLALSQSDLCKERNHCVRLVKATKRFFKCKECGNRTMSLDRLPKSPCTHCKSSSWLAAPVGKEKNGPTLDSERLSLRGDEEKFLGSTSSKLFL